MHCRNALAALVLAAAAAGASAADYTVTNVTGRWETVPATAPDVLAGVGQGRLSETEVELPFVFSYYGAAYSKVWVASRGYLQFGVLLGNSQSNNTWFPTAASEDGILAACWDQPSASKASVWTAGTAPNRRFIVAWELRTETSTPNKFAYAQAILHETTDRIVLAYTAHPTLDGWVPFGTPLSYTIGLDSPGDARFTAPAGNDNGLKGRPASDYQLDPVLVTVTGRAAFDRLIADASGIGGSTEFGAPAGLLRVELRSGSKLLAVSRCDALGGFALGVAAPPAGATGSVSVVADGDAAAVAAAPGGAATSIVLGGPYTLASDADVGTLTATSASDPAGTARAALGIAQTIGLAHAWASSRTASSIPRLDVVYAPGSAAPTSYTKASTSPAAMQVGAASSGNEDGWDRAVVLRHYARHLLAAVAGLPVTAPDARFDAATTPENAFAEATGYYLGAVVLGTSTYVDALDAASAAVVDLEDPKPTSPKAQDVAAWAASVLYDTTDAANEVHDRIAGEGPALDRAFLAVESMSAAPTLAAFFDAWIAKGYDSKGIRRMYIALGFLADDASEPNDDIAEPEAGAAPGWNRTGFTLNVDNEDWFSVPVATPVDALFADMAFPRSLNAAQVLVEITDGAGAVRASAVTQPGFGPVRCGTGALAAGTYRVRVAHTSGPAIPAYSLQVFTRIAVGPDVFPDWTVDRPYTVPLDIDGGVPPITLTTTPGSPLPPGLFVDSSNARVSGTPTAPGQYSISIQAQDSGNPANMLTVARTFVLAKPLELGVGGFVAFPLGRTLARGAVSSGGTAPRVFRVTEGSLPGGVSLAPDRLEFTGAATAAGSARFVVDGGDVAGSQAAAEVTGVVCVPPDDGAPMTLAAGDAACGFWFDALAGSTVSVAVTTAKRQPKRALEGAVLLPDGTSAVPGGKSKARLGKWSASSVVCPASGRYFVAVRSVTGDVALLGGSAKIVLPKSGRAAVSSLGQGETVGVPVGVLAGARLTLKAAPAKGSSLHLAVQALVDPDGVFVAPGAAATPAGNGVALDTTLAKSGTWTVVLSAQQGSGGLSYAYKLAQPKGATYAAD